jgi:hypothetical protein
MERCVPEWNFCLVKESSMPTGSNPKREHEFDKLKKEFKQEHRYAGREEEVAARIVNKQRREAGETKSATSHGKTSKSGTKSKTSMRKK